VFLFSLPSYPRLSPWSQAQPAEQTQCLASIVYESTFLYLTEAKLANESSDDAIDDDDLHAIYLSPYQPSLAQYMTAGPLSSSEHSRRAWAIRCCGLVPHTNHYDGLASLPLLIRSSPSRSSPTTHHQPQRHEQTTTNTTNIVTTRYTHHLAYISFPSGLPRSLLTSFRAVFHLLHPNPTYTFLPSQAPPLRPKHNQ